VAKDVCEILDIGRPQDSVRYLEEDEKGRCLVDTPSAEQDMLIISEPGLYSLILRSRKPEARVCNLHRLASQLNDKMSFIDENISLSPADEEGVHIVDTNKG